MGCALKVSFVVYAADEMETCVPLSDFTCFFRKESLTVAPTGLHLYESDVAGGLSSDNHWCFFISKGTFIHVSCIFVFLVIVFLPASH